MPVPKPIEDRIPKPTHQTVYQNQSSTFSSSSVCCPALSQSTLIIASILAELAAHCLEAHVYEASWPLRTPLIAEKQEFACLYHQHS